MYATKCGLPFVRVEGRLKEAKQGRGRNVLLRGGGGTRQTRGERARIEQKERSRRPGGDGTARTVNSQNFTIIFFSRHFQVSFVFYRFLQSSKDSRLAIGLRFEPYTAIRSFKTKK